MSIKKYIPLICGKCASRFPLVEQNAVGYRTAYPSAELDSFKITILTPLWHLGDSNEIVCHEERITSEMVYKNNSADVDKINVEYSVTRRCFEIYKIHGVQAIREGRKPWKPYGKNPLLCTVESFVEVFDKACKEKNERALSFLHSLCN